MIEVKDSQFKITNSNVETVFMNNVTPNGNSGKINCPKRYVGKKVYIVVIKDD